MGYGRARTVSLLNSVTPMAQGVPDWGNYLEYGELFGEIITVFLTVLRPEAFELVTLGQQEGLLSRPLGELHCWSDHI